MHGRFSPHGPGAAARALFLAAAFAHLAPIGATAADWKGTEETVAGSLHVKNPASPIEPPQTIELEELWRVGGMSEDEHELFGVITQVKVDGDGNVYLLDSQLNEVKVFSKDGAFVEVLGGEGEGPGEFVNPFDMFFLPNGNVGVMQTAPGRIAQIGVDGTPESDYPVPASEEGGFIVLRRGDSAGDQLVLGFQTNAFTEGKVTQTHAIIGSNAEGSQTAEFHSDARDFDMANPVVDEAKWDSFDRRWIVGRDDRVFAALDNERYAVHCWNLDGKINRVIERAYTPLPRTQDEIDHVRGIYEKFMRQMPNAKIVIMENAPVVNSLYAGPGNTLWLLTGRGAREKPADAIGTFDVFDADGRFARQVTLKGEGDPLADGYFFAHDRVLVVTDLVDAMVSAFGQSGADDDVAEAEPMSVICYRLDTDMVAMK